MQAACVKTTYEHIEMNRQGVPLITGTTMKIIELVLVKSAYGWSAEELRFQFPNLTLGQIYSALAYYEDHQEELDKDIEQRLKFVNQLRKSSNPSPIVKRLKSKGLI